MSWPIDVVGFDGWFWDVSNPLRRLVDQVLPTWLAMGGAVRFTEPVPPAPFPRDPGPDRPYVVPRILGQPDTRAVINQTRIGPHIGWNTTYFTTSRFHRIPLENLWGGNQYELYDADGRWRAWGEHTQVETDYDFELRPWIESGKLFWILPDDPDLVLRNGIVNCPYLDIPGTEIIQDLPVVALR
ncbi:hypothetical protein [Nocardia sp. GTS18]|uniref:hypothetical protein n=1 Tax=Nocardia sp. GTS18 TaxID=1778064 RepID=UPI0015EF3881|nr:hypothetical protein [Nocardia sp. GTS18]